MLISYLPILAGIGLFLFGMSLMGSSLEKIAGAKMEKTLERLTTNRISGVLLGTVVTGLIQSSAATTVMVVGFVNAGIMKLSQAVSVIMGANIGTTVTGQIIRLSSVGEGSGSWMALLKPSSFAPILIFIGASLVLFTKKTRTKTIGEMFLGFGILFFGMSIMETTLSPLKNSPTLINAFGRFENPLLGIALGAGVTALLQSSSASVGLLQALSTTGAISFAMMVPVVFGQNIGTCITVILASIGANRNAKRAAMIHLSFNIIGTIIFFVAIYGFQALIGIPFFDNAVDMGDIANFHTLFNFTNVIILLPFCNGLVKLAKFLIRDKGEKKGEANLLDERFLATPSIAVDMCREMTLKMGQAAAANVDIASGLLTNYDRRALENLNENERFCDKTESHLTGYLMKLTLTELSDKENRMTSEMFRSLSDFERISDRAVNIAETAEYNLDNGVTFSDTVKQELKLLSDAANEILAATVRAYESMDSNEAAHIEPFEEIIDELTDELKSRHVDRLQAGICNIQAGISYVELLTNYERIADHCSNIAVYIIELNSADTNFDRHEHLKQVHRGLTQDYKTYYADYENRYIKPLQKLES